MKEINTENYVTLTAKYLRGEASEFEKNLLLEWVEEKATHKALFEEAKKTWALTSQPGITFTPDEDMAWQKVRSKLTGLTSTKRGSSPVPVQRHIAPKYFVYRVAAALLLALGIGYISWQYFQDQEKMMVVTTEKGKMNFYLPDGSRVWLNRNSKFSYQNDFYKERKVFLEGEAFFDVQKFQGKSFMIYTDRSVTSVLGTSFIVKANKNDSQHTVKVFTGKVSFSLKEKRGSIVYLTPGMTGVAGRSGKIEISKEIDVNAGAWKEEKLIFENADITKIAETLSSYFGTTIKIERDDLKNCRFTGTFSKPVLNEVLQVLSVSLNLSHEKTGDGYKLVGQGCK
jgi:transmembrane sensor